MATTIFWTTERLQKELEEIRNRYFSDIEEVQNMVVANDTVTKEVREMAENASARVAKLAAELKTGLNDICCHQHNERHELKMWAQNLFQEQNGFFAEIGKDIKALKERNMSLESSYTSQRTDSQAYTN